MMNTVSVCQCGAQLDWLTGTMKGSCGEPCRFVMMKSGEGRPPIPTEDFIMGYRAAIYERGQNDDRDR